MKDNLPKTLKHAQTASVLKLIDQQFDRYRKVVFAFESKNYACNATCGHGKLITLNHFYDVPWYKRKSEHEEHVVTGRYSIRYEIFCISFESYVNQRII